MALPKAAVAGGSQRGETGKVSTIRLVVVDDHPVVLTGLKGMLSTIEDFEIVGEAYDGEGAIRVAAELNPDAMLMDVRLPGLNGLEALRRIRERQPRIAVVLITVSDSDLYLVEALRWGASGYLTKDSSRELIADAIRAATGGGTTISSALVEKCFSSLARSTRDLGEPEDDESLPPLVELTPRELDVLRLVSKGHTNRAICAELCLAEVTVKKYVQRIMGKMGVRDRTQAALRGVRLGLID
ncbi:MAG: response regulator transcription factor [Armatimonadetes bacterium]|nr:response regulator transcription factor [Armatimonadota bacterium]